MNSFAELLKRSRKNSGMSQKALAEKMNVSVITVQNWENGRTKVDLCHLKELAYYFSVPVDTLIKEMLAQEDMLRRKTWPAFLFDDDTNKIVGTLHLNLLQQDLFGILYIYGAECLQDKEIERETYLNDLHLIPFEFINKAGSIQFLNIAEGLWKVLRYVKPAFLLKVLKADPEEEFDVCRLNKDMICEFIRSGYRTGDPDHCSGRQEEILSFSINIKYAREMLPVLERNSLHIGNRVNGREEYVRDWPAEILELNRVKEILRLNRDRISDPADRSSILAHTIREGLGNAAQINYAAGKDGSEKILLEITDEGHSLLKWFKDKEV